MFKVITLFQLPFWLFFFVSAEANEFSDSVEAALRDQSNYLASLITDSRKQNLALDPMWTALMHYQYGLLGAESEVDGADFFLAERGKVDPQAELEATVASFFSSSLIEPTRHVSQCRFVARYQWLKQKLNFDPQRLPEKTCDDYALYQRLLAPESLTVVFPTTHPGSPSSMFGHTLLRINKKGWSDQTRLLNYSVNFAAQVPKDVNPFTYAASGLGGGFQGRFTVLPYYSKLREYAQMENRDIWEYQLNLTPQQLDWVVGHVYELGPTYFDYYFFTENCSYHLLSLLDVAFPENPLTSEYRYWTIPADTLRTLERRKLIASARFYPSSSRLIETKQKNLLPEDVVLAAAFLSKKEDEKLDTLSVARQAAVLDLAHDYYRYTKLKNAEMSDGSLDDTERVLLARRAKMRVASPVVEVAAPTIRPDFGHNTARLGFGYAHLPRTDAVTLNWRPAYHDLLDNSEGYVPNSSLQFVDVRATYIDAKSQLRLEEFTLLDILSLEPLQRFFHQHSWGLRAGWRRDYLATGDSRGVAYFNGGAGYTLNVLNHSDTFQIYGLFEGEVVSGDVLENGYRIGLGPRIGIVAEPLRHWRFFSSAFYSAGLLGDRKNTFTVSVDQAFSLSTNLALTLRFARYFVPHQAESGLFGVVYYY